MHNTDDELPVRAPRNRLAEFVTNRYFKVSPRSLERWPVTWRRVNGKAHAETAEVFAVAEAMLAAAPPVKAGSRHKSEW